MGNTRQQPKKKVFLEAIRETGNVSRAAKAADIHRCTHYKWLKGDEDYVEEFAVAMEDAADILEEEAWRRAVEGVDEPAGWYQGTAGGTVRKYSDTLLIFLLKGARPNKFRDNVKVSGDKNAPVVFRVIYDDE